MKADKAPYLRIFFVHFVFPNEKYKGFAVLQKRFTIDFLNKKQKINEGEVPQYLVRNSHPAIIEPEFFDLVQFEMKRRREDGRWTSSAHPFSSKILCGDCGAMYGSKMWNSTSEYRSVVWQCNSKYKGDHKCGTTHLTESQIKTAFLAAFNDRLNNRAEIFEAYDEVLQALTDNTTLDAEAAELQDERGVVIGLIEKAVKENASTPLDQAEYQRRYESLTKRYEAANARLSELEAIRLERNAKRMNISRFLQTLVKREDDLVTEFDEELWYITVDFIKVYDDRRLEVTFRDGCAVTISQELWRAA